MLKAESMDRELDTLVKAARQAGYRILQLGKEGFHTRVKHDRSPVTTADLEADRILKEALLSAFPDDGWLSEEAPDNPRRLEHKRVWIVDPIDGTKYFMRGLPQFAVSAALVVTGVPVVAVIFNPATDELFSARRGAGAGLNGRSIQVRQALAGRPTILVNPGAFDRGKFKAYEPYAECRPMGSIAYTLALVAAGRADATLNFERMNEWDIVAGAFLVEEAGGFARDQAGKPLAFNRPNTAVQGILAGSLAAREPVARLLGHQDLRGVL